VEAHATFPRDEAAGQAVSPVSAQALQELFDMEAGGMDALALENFR
jgi:predicted TIM-barrel enzyme